jgi:uncharacterized surface protein with fasciclin (FAS1) repeats
MNRSTMMIALALLLPACGGGSAANTTSNQSATSGSEQPAAAANIVDTAVGAGQFQTLVAAVRAAGLVETLSGPGPFTVFAPTDAAFAALPAGTVDTLLLPENRDRLRAILTYHVVAGDVRAAQVTTMTSATTVQGASLPISTVDGQVRVGEATVVNADVVASNGVIHVIDRVLLPPN